MIDRRPAVIVRCAGAADVLHCIRIARESGLIVSVRGGGHSVAGLAVCDDGLMIDLSLARGVRVDPAGRAALAAGGATWGDFDYETQAFGLATTGGVVRATGIAGLTLAGGHGLLMRKYGLACDNLLSVDLATADGRLVKASAEEHADPFFGACEEVAAISGLQRPSNTDSIRSDRFSAACWCTRSTRLGTCSASTTIL